MEERDTGQGFASMLFLTPPKVDASESPFIEVMETIGNALKEENDEKSLLISNDLMKLLDGTPLQQQEALSQKQFIPNKSSRNILSSFDEISSKPSSFSFPEGGWVCSTCQNYNFYGRHKCNRCQKLKSLED